MNRFEEFLEMRERQPVVIELEDYRLKLLSYGPTPEEANQSLVLQVENAVVGNVAAMIAAASRNPRKMMLVPSSAAAANIRIVANGGETAKVWQPQSILKQTALNMGKLGRVLQMAQGGISKWNGAKIIVAPAPKVLSEPATDGLIKVDKCGCGNTFKAGIFGKGLRVRDIGGEPSGAFDLDSDTQSDFSSLIDALKNGFDTKPRIIKMFFTAPKTKRKKLEKAKKEAAILQTAYIPPVPLKTTKPDSTDDIWSVRVDERLLGVPINDTYWPAEDEPLEIRYLTLETNEDQHS